MGEIELERGDRDIALLNRLKVGAVVERVLDLVEPELAQLAIETTSLLDRQQAFGYTQEDLKVLMAPMAQTGQEAVGSMGNDAPISALSDRPKMLDTYFKQNFAQVTNPPIDPIREELVMSLVSFIGPRPNLLDLKGTSTHMRLEVAQPILTNEDLERIRTIGAVADNPFRTAPGVPRTSTMAMTGNGLSATASAATFWFPSSGLIN